MSLKLEKQFRRRGASLSWRVGFMAAITVSVGTMRPQTYAAEARALQDQASEEVRFAVAHQHSFSWCYGYLYVSADKVRYAVSQPESNRDHSFAAQRAEVTVHRWAILGQPQDAIELKVKGVTYHMRWLANESEVNTGSAKRMRPPTSAAPATLIAAIQNPASLVAKNPSPDASAGSGMPGGKGPGKANSDGALNPALANSTAPSTSSTTSTSGSPLAIASASVEAPHELPPGMLQGVYVCTAGGNGQPTNKQYIFYPDGLMVYGLPQEGMLGFDFDHYRSESNRTGNWVGRYQVDGSQVKIVWQNQFSDPAHPALIKINETSAHPAWDAGWDTFIPMCRCTGKTFSGKYRWGAPAADQYIEFFVDGSFIDHRVTDQLIVPSQFYEHPRVQRGTYSIQSQTLIFTFADGHRGTRTFLAPKVQENDPKFDWIDLGWQMLFEENYLAKLSH